MASVTVKPRYVGAVVLAFVATAALALLFGLIDLFGGDMSWSTLLITLGGLFIINLVTQVAIAKLYEAR